MSNFLDALLREQGCAIDGAATASNPLTSMVDRIFGTATTSGSGLAAGQASSAGGFAFYDQAPQLPQQSWLPGAVDTSHLDAAWSQAQGGSAGMAPMFMGGSQQQQHHQMMMMQMQMMQQQQMQAMMMGGMGMGMGMGGFPYAQQQHQLQQQQLEQEQQQQEEYEAAEQEGLEATPSSGWSESASDLQRKADLEGAMEAALRGQGAGGLAGVGVERLEEIWESFGIDGQTRGELRGALGQAQGQGQGQTADGLGAQGSREGYRDAWNKIAARLEQPQEVIYSFVNNNPLLAVGDPLAAHAAQPAHVPQQQQPQLEASEAFAQGMAHFAAGRVRDAILAFEAACQLGPDTADEAWRMLGACHAESDEDKKAIVCLDRCLALDPFNLRALLMLGTSHVNELDSVKALGALKAWVAHHPALSSLRPARDEYSDGTLMDEVTQLMLAAAELCPDDAEVHVSIGVLYNVSLDYASAQAHFLRALACPPADEGSSAYATLNKLGATLANANRSDEAVGLYARALQQRPTYARGWLNLGISFANLNKHSEAAKAYLQALHLNPRAAHIWGYLRVVFTCLERLDLVEACGRAHGGREAEVVRELAAALGLDLISEPSSLQAGAGAGPVAGVGEA